jgi:hypothetical protein
MFDNRPLQQTRMQDQATPTDTRPGPREALDALGGVAQGVANLLDPDSNPMEEAGKIFVGLAMAGAGLPGGPRGVARELMRRAFDK